MCAGRALGRQADGANRRVPAANRCPVCQARAMPAHALIELRDVDIAVGSQALVRRLSLDIAPGRVLVIVSERADIRTAITSVLSGAIDDYTVGGDLVLEGRELIARVASGTQAEQHVARIHGPLDARTRVRDLADAQVLDLVQLNALTVVDERVHSLDEEGRIRAAFAAALSGQPRLVVLDLPYRAEAGNPYLVYASLVQRLGRSGDRAIVITTDSLAVAADLADEVLVTLDGVALEYGSVYDVCMRPASPYVRELLRVTPSPHRELPDITAFVDLARHAGCPWVLNCREDVLRACAHITPALHPVAPGHAAACHLIGADDGS